MLKSDQSQKAEWRCECHLKHSSKLDTHDDQIKSINVELGHKVPNKLFYTFYTTIVLLLLGTLGFQWANFVKLTVLDTKVAVVETKLNLHMENQEKKKIPYYFIDPKNTSITHKTER